MRLIEALDKELSSRFWAYSARALLIDKIPRTVDAVKIWGEQRSRVAVIDTRGANGGDRYSYAFRLPPIGNHGHVGDRAFSLVEVEQQLYRNRTWLIVTTGPIYAAPIETLLSLCDRQGPDGKQESKLLMVCTLQEYRSFLREASPALKNQLVKPYEVTYGR